MSALSNPASTDATQSLGNVIQTLDLRILGVGVVACAILYSVTHRLRRGIWPEDKLAPLRGATGIVSLYGSLQVFAVFNLCVDSISLGTLDNTARQVIGAAATWASLTFAARELREAFLGAWNSAQPTTASAILASSTSPSTATSQSSSQANKQAV